ncbi:hypothetical protein ACFWMR_01270 [Amycolatopsis thailandensis]|uniref:hypothetical protein n=1 Tax=Amycolatopsis thailandensis TaxID=589330 RepID=UPI003660F61C
MDLKLHTGIDVGANDEECAAVIAVDKRALQKVTPFGATVDLLLDLALKHGLTRLNNYTTFDPASQPVVADWKLNVERPGLVTIDYSAGQLLTSRRLECPERWLSAASSRGTVNLLVVGGNGSWFRTGTNALAELDAAAQFGQLVAGAIAFSGPSAKANPTPNWMNWPLHGLTISAEGGQFALNISSPDRGLLNSFPLNPDEVKPLAKALSRAVASSTEPVNISAIVREVTGRHLPPPGRD